MKVRKEKQQQQLTTRLSFTARHGSGTIQTQRDRENFQSISQQLQNKSICEKKTSAEIRNENNRNTVQLRNRSVKLKNKHTNIWRRSKRPGVVMKKIYKLHFSK